MQKVVNLRLLNNHKNKWEKKKKEYLIIQIPDFNCTITTGWSLDEK